jgi:pSer/pThr/pTyr-binding forkhead associated (FHA) protein
MGDPRLNSIHLDGSNRRDQYRRAREKLLGARGFHTLIAERQEEAEVDRPDTIIQGPVEGQADELVFWLQDQQDECIYPLKVGINTAGRSEDNDVVVNDSYVSRRHCAILVHAGRGCELHDTASKNGTYLNGNRIAGPTRLKAGDEIRLCGKHFIFRSKNEPAERGSGTLSVAL